LADPFAAQPAPSLGALRLRCLQEATQNTSSEIKPAMAGSVKRPLHTIATELDLRPAQQPCNDR
jgi:hypothetical protein